MRWVTWEQLVSFAVAAELLLIIPGPSVLFTISRGVTYGRRAAMATVAGNSLGAFAQATAVALGLGALIATSATVFTAMKFGGAIYVVYLGARAVRERRSLSEALRSADGPLRSTRQLMRDGFVVGVSNVKTALFYVAVLPQFVQADGPRPAVQLWVLCLVFSVLSFASDSIYGLAAGSVRDWLRRKPKRMEAVGGAGGMALIGLGVRIAFGAK